MEAIPVATALPIGFYEAPLRTTAGITTMCVWLPLKAMPEQQHSMYRMTTSVCKKISIITTGGGVPWPNLTRCFEAYHTSDLPTATSVGAATPDMVADVSSVRGLVVLAHGLADGPLVLAHVCERLAGLGFVVAAPAFADSANNDQRTVLDLGRHFVAEATGTSSDLQHTVAWRR